MDNRTSSALPKFEDGDNIQELCRLLTSFSQEELRLLEQRISSPSQRAMDISEVLAEAVRISTSRDTKLANNLAPIVEGGVSASIRNNPRQFTEILAPVMGPAIRASILNALRDYTSSVDRVLQNSFSVKSLGWRFEAARTGKSFAEIVLYHTLEYRVEHIFLIRRSDGTLISQVSTSDRKTEAPDAVSGMLTAIDDFVNDSFGVDSNRGLGQMQIGDLTVLICKGSSSLIAAVVRGEVPDGFRTEIVSAVETFEFEYAEELNDPDRDSSAFLAFDQRLISLLQMKLRHESDSSESSSNWKKVGFGALVCAGLAWYFVESFREERRWSNFFNYVDDQPGIVVTGIEKEGKYYRLKGLKDPMSVNPNKLYLQQDFFEEDRLVFDFQPFHSLEREMVQERVIRAFNPPTGVSMVVDSKGILTVVGLASAEWVGNISRDASGFAGISGVEMSRLSVPPKTMAPKRFPQLSRYNDLLAEIKEKRIVFDSEISNLTNNLGFEARKDLDDIAKIFIEMSKLSHSLNYRPRFIALVQSPTRRTGKGFSAVEKIQLDKLVEELAKRAVPLGLVETSEYVDKEIACSQFPEDCKEGRTFLYFQISQ